MAPRANNHPRYIVISPAKDEQQFIERTIRSMLRQTTRPQKWVIVNDGSLDRTPQIIDKYARQNDWIVKLTIERDARRRLGVAEIQAFYAGYNEIADEDWDFIVKLDTDLELPRDYFERMLAEFEADPRLGIASGGHLEERRGAWAAVKMPSYHAAGASKILRRACFQDIGGLPRQAGWDTADEIKAQARGWHTRHFSGIRFYHLRPEGLGSGRLRTGALHGRIYYVCGGGLLFFVLKFLHRLVVGKPFVTGALALLYGYLRASVSGAPRLVSQEEARSYRKLLHSRLLGSFKGSATPARSE